MAETVGLKALFSAAIAALSIYLGELVIPVIILILVMMADYLTGMAKAWFTKTLSSKIGIRGFIKKTCYLIVVCVGMGADWLIASGLAEVGVEMPVTFMIGMMVVIWLIINELLSILENLAIIGVPMPGFLISVIEKIKRNVCEEPEQEHYAGEPAEKYTPKH